jgi:hypothetical protein
MIRQCTRSRVAVNRRGVGGTSGLTPARSDSLHTDPTRVPCMKGDAL